MENQYIWLYITCSSKTEAENIARHLLENRLIACANISENITSMYWWEDEIQKDSETQLVCKSTRALFQSVLEHVKARHSYSCPCVVALPIQDGNPEFTTWIGEETKTSNP